jgi:hypothetical protein
MRRLFIVAFALMSFVANSAAEQRPPTQAEQCYRQSLRCLKACGKDDLACDIGCREAEDSCNAPGAKIDIRGVPKTGAGPVETKDIPPAGNGKSAGGNTKPGAATGATIDASGPMSTPTKPAPSSSPGGGSPTSVSGGSGLTNRKLQ